MSDDVIEIGKFVKKRPERVWECNCGGQHFYLNYDGTIECRSCKLIFESIMWAKRS